MRLSRLFILAELHAARLRERQISVGTAGPQPQAPDLNGTAGPQPQAPDLKLQISMGTAGPQPQAPLE